MKVIGGTAFVKIYQPKKLKAFREYCDDELVKVVYSFSEGVDRMDFVFDRYLKNSIKTQNSEDRKKEMRISVRRDTLFCEDFKQITRFQADLFLMISNSISQIRNVPTSAVKECNTYDVHENCSIFMTPHSLVHLRPKFFHPLDLEHPISNIFPLPHFQMIINQLKENMIEG